jgi:large subunit ribosomal protein L5
MTQTQNGSKPRLRARYEAEIVPALKDRFSFSTVMQVPRLEKIVVNMGLGEAVRDAKILELATADLEIITGQEVDRRFQAPGRDADRREGDAARRPDVGIL